jgi:hypothetical protein
MQRDIQLFGASKGALVMFKEARTILAVLYISLEGTHVRASFESSEGHGVIVFLLQDGKLVLGADQTRVSRFAERCIRSVWEELRPHLLS